jgi:hypothetical protein
MSIRARTEDAYFLLQNDRHDGALLSACAAISATSRRRYPVSSGMGDRAAFTRFLGEEIRLVTGGAIVNWTLACPGADPAKYPTGMMLLQDVLYQFVRCHLAHEAAIASDVLFLKDDRLSTQVDSGRLIFGGAMLPRLLLVPEFAPENAAEFPEAAALTADEFADRMFGARRHAHLDYVNERERRLGRASESPT